MSKLEGESGTGDDPLPAEHLSSLATLVDEVFADVGDEMTTATDDINDAVPGYGGLFDPATTQDELRRALEYLLKSGLARPSNSISRLRRYSQILLETTLEYKARIVH
nr:hypothetical protein [Natronoarchaeum rubrum]